MSSVSSPSGPRTPHRQSMVSGLFSGSGAEPKLHRSSTPESRKHSEVEDGTNRIKVICRVRPLTADENAFQEMTSAGNNTVAVLGRESPQNFTFDKVFDVSASQSDIYDYSIKDTVNDVLNGYNGTILAYGQTGAGKSYTMLGPSISGDLEKGLIPRISDEIFHQIKTNGSNDIEYTVSLSIMEIYLEQINDFLVADNVKLSIHEDRDHGIYVKGLSHAFISNTEELYKLLQLGIKHRASHVTNMNMESSRSHAIFQIKIDQKNLKDESIKKSNLFLIDLAGSEKVDKTGAVGQTLKEAQNINSSLSALGNVINALTDHKSTHIPYRDSKLTRILQESLGGNSRTTLILNVSPSSVNELETISTLRFGSRAKHIKNRAYINKELSPAELKFRLSQLQRENEQNKLYIEKLENQLKNGGRAFTGPVTPSKDFESRIPTLTKSPKSPNLNAEKDQKIKQLEDEILSYKINNLKISNEEEIKLNKLEKSLYKLNEKMSEVEIININLRKHLMLSEKIIEQRDESVQYLNKLLNEQQMSLTNQTSHFENRLSLLKHRINEQRIQSINVNKSPGSPTSPSTPRSPFTGLNLKIIKPIVGGTDASDSEDEDEDQEKENIPT